jgi:hypothetical protein
VAAGRHVLKRVAEGRGLPFGETAQARRLIRRALGAQDRALVLGPPGAVRQALPSARLDVVGTDPRNGDVTVVSDAVGEGTLPRRWDCVVLIEGHPSPERVLAAAGACLPGGLIAVLTARSPQPVTIPGSRPYAVRHARKVQLVMARSSA